jgi:hypothetical protein
MVLCDRLLLRYLTKTCIKLDGWTGYHPPFAARGTNDSYGLIVLKNSKIQIS